MRIMGALSDLHAADARYHDDCRKSLMLQRSVVFALKVSSQCKDHALNSTVSEMQSDKSCVWTCGDPQNIHNSRWYIFHGHNLFSR